MQLHAVLLRVGTVDKIIVVESVNMMGLAQR